MRKAFTVWAESKRKEKGRKYTGTDLANLINKKAGTSLKKQSISLYMNPDSMTIPSEKVFNALSSILGPDIRPQGNDEKYSNSPEYQREFLRKLRRKASDKGLLPFIRWIKDMPSFDEVFPLYLPIRCVAKANGFDIEYVAERFVPAAASIPKSEYAASLTKENSLFQINKGGNLFDLSYADIAFLSDMKEHLEKCAVEYMRKRAEEMTEEVKIANDKMNIQQGEITIATNLTNEDLCKIEKYRSEQIEGLKADSVK